MDAILGYLVATTLSMLAMVGFINFANQGVKNVQNASVASETRAINKAFSQYVQDNAAAISGTATAAAPVRISVPMLACANYLPISYAAGASCPSNNAAQGALNAFGQYYFAQVLQPSAGQLQIFVFTTGGRAIADTKQLVSIAAQVGGEGGFVPYANQGADATMVNTNAYGAYGMWGPVSLANYTNPGSGHLASLLAFSNANADSSHLYRVAVAGQPQLNTMTTPLVMADTETLGAACTTTGAIAQDGSGAVVSCQGGAWQTQGSAYWKDPAINFAGLPTCNAAAQWQTRVVETPSVGTGPRAYTCDGVSWQALAVDDSGNLVLPGNLSVAGNATITGNETVSGTATLNKLAGTLQVTPTATAGAACSPNGSLAQDGTGLILSCQSGVWTAGRPKIVSSVGTYCASGGVTTACPANTTVVSCGYWNTHYSGVGTPVPESLFINGNGCYGGGGGATSGNCFRIYAYCAQ